MKLSSHEPTTTDARTAHPPSLALYTKFAKTGDDPPDERGSFRPGNRESALQASGTGDWVLT